MQSTSETWKELAALEGTRVEAKAIINNVEYIDIEPPVITRGTMQNGVSVGNVVSAMCMLTLDTSNTIPKSAEIQIQARLVSGTEDEPVYSEWLPQGTFYLSRRTKTPNTNTIVLECYDGLLKSNAIWEPSTGDWPRQASAVLAEIATIIGLQVDASTTIAAYTIGEPEAGATMRDMLGIIAQQNFGNWIVTHDNKLRLVPVVDLADAESATETVEVDAVIGDYYADEVKTVTGLRVNSDGITTLIGDETGVVVDLTIPAAIATQLADSVIGITYKPFTFGTAFYDIAAELGDFVHFYDTTSVLYNETVTLGPSMHGDIAAPDTADIGDEYPYVGVSEKNLYTAKSYAEAVANEAVGEYDESLTQQQIFNKLTDNRAAKGIVLLGNQLYINATYLGSGTIDGGLVNAKLLNIVDADGNVIASFDNTIRLGRTGLAQAEIDSNSFEIKDANGDTLAYFGDIRDEHNRIVSHFVSDGSKYLTVITGPTYDEVTIDSVGVDGVLLDPADYEIDYIHSMSTLRIVFNTAPESGSEIDVYFISNMPVLRFDAGIRRSGYDIGSYSFVCGYNNVASGANSHVEGQYSHATGAQSHAEGRSTHSESTGTHSEGVATYASSYASHSEGYNTRAIGWASHAEGEGTIAKFRAQHVFGQYNIPDPSTARSESYLGTYVEIVGNGHENEGTEDYLSNARTLDWNGNEYISGALSVGDAAGTRANLGITPANIGALPDTTTASDIGAVAKTGDTMTGALQIDDATPSSSASTGALVVDGGAGIGGDANVGGALSVGDPATTKGNLGLGTADMNFRVTSPTGSNQGFMMSGVVQNSNYPSRLGHRVGVIPRETGLSFYDGTNAESIWSFTLPLPVNRGGFGGTTAAEARDNLSVAATFILTADYTTAATIYSVLSTMARGSVATISIRAAASNAMCGVNYDMYGTIWRAPASTSNNYYLSMTRTSGIEQYCYVLTLTASSMSHGTVYKYTGTAV